MPHQWMLEQRTWELFLLQLIQWKKTSTCMFRLLDINIYLDKDQSRFKEINDAKSIITILEKYLLASMELNEEH